MDVPQQQEPAFVPEPHSRMRVRRAWAAGTAMVIVLAAGAGSAWWLRDRDGGGAHDEDAVAVVTTDPFESPFATASPTPLPTIPIPTAAIEGESADRVVADFYAAFAAGDKARIFSFFVPPASDEERELLSLLQNGQSLDGIPGGPTLFESNSASGKVVSHTVTATSERDGSFTYTVEETADYFEASGVRRTRTLEVVPSGEGYAIAGYRSEPGTVKYNGFLN